MALFLCLNYNHMQSLNETSVKSYFKGGVNCLQDIYGCMRDIKYSPRKLNMIAAQVSTCVKADDLLPTCLSI